MSLSLVAWILEYPEKGVMSRKGKERKIREKKGKGKGKERGRGKGRGRGRDGRRGVGGERFTIVFLVHHLEDFRHWMLEVIVQYVSSHTHNQMSNTALWRTDYEESDRCKEADDMRTPLRRSTHLPWARGHVLW